MENNKIFNNKNIGNVNMYNKKLLLIDNTLYDEIYKVLTSINNILKLQESCYKKYLYPLRFKMGRSVGASFEIATGNLVEELNGVPFEFFNGVKSSNNNLYNLNNLEKITPQLLNEKNDLINSSITLFNNINELFKKKLNIYKKLQQKFSEISNEEMKLRILEKINEDKEKIKYTAEYNNKLTDIYSKIDKKDIYVKKLNKKCASKFWMNYFLSENNTFVENKKKTLKKIENREITNIINNNSNNNINNNFNNNLINTKVINKSINNKNIITNNILNFFKKDYLINIKNKEIDTTIFPPEFNNILSEQNKNRFKNIKIFVNGRNSGLYIEIQDKNGKSSKYTPYGHMSFHFLEDWSNSPIHLKANNTKSKNNIGIPLIDCFLKKTNYGIIIINRSQYKGNSVIIFIIDICILALNQLYNEYQHTL
jgi:hypothetical protein